MSAAEDEDDDEEEERSACQKFGGQKVLLVNWKKNHNSARCTWTDEKDSEATKSIKKCDSLYFQPSVS